MSNAWKGFPTRVLAGLVACSVGCLPISAQDSQIDRPWNRDVIYFTLTDRFHDGDPGNDVPAGALASTYDASQADIRLYHGGDLRGLEIALEDGYFTDLRVSAIWITPPVENVWWSPADHVTGYHGYWTRDFLDIDPHLTSATRLSDGSSYSNDRDGRMQHYKDFVTLAHSKGIKVIQDIVCNHVGQLFFYDVNRNGALDADSEWELPFLWHGSYGDVAWVTQPAWNTGPAHPSGPLTVLGRAVGTSGLLHDFRVYGRKGFNRNPSSLGKSDGEEVLCDFYNLRDLWTAPDSAFFDQLVDEFVEIYHFYIDEVGVDGLRVDTVRHVHREFWDAFTQRLRERLGEDRTRLIIFGETYSFDPQIVGKYTYRTDSANPCMDSMLNFPLCAAVRAYLQVSGNGFGHAGAIENAINLTYSNNPAYYNAIPGADGLAARQKMVNFIGNHDGLNRFRVQNVSQENNALALGLLLVMEGIPCIYYGSEVARQAPSGIGEDSESGRITLFRRDGRGHSFVTARQDRTFRIVASVADWRQRLRALSEGEIKSLWVDSPASQEDDGVFALARYVRTGNGIETSESVIVVLNANPYVARTTGYGDNVMQLTGRHGEPLMAPGQKLVRCTIEGQDPPGGDAQTIIPQFRNGVPHARIMTGPKTINVYTVVSEP